MLLARPSTARSAPELRVQAGSVPAANFPKARLTGDAAWASPASSVASAMLTAKTEPEPALQRFPLALIAPSSLVGPLLWRPIHHDGTPPELRVPCAELRGGRAIAAAPS